MATCPQCSSSFEIRDIDHRFCEKMKVPPPTLCPICRMQRRMAYRNDRALFKSKSALSGQPIVTMYDPKENLVIYDQKEWWGDSWDPMRYGRDFDFSRPFFEQFHELQKAVPRFNVFNRNTQNCEYVNYAPHSKNCYLVFGSWFLEDCLYGQTLSECQNCIDNLFLDKSQWCYENADGNNNYKALFCQNCHSASESYFCFDCKNVQNCIGCWNLKDKKYHILNKPASKEEYEKMRARFSSASFVEKYKEYFKVIVKEQALHKYMAGLNNENVTGDFIFNSKDVHFSFSAYRCRDIAYCCRMFDQKDTYDFEGGGKGELVYEGMSNDFSFNSISCMTCEHMTNGHYCDLCFNCENCLGCVSLRRKQHCILNKQYGREEYDVLSAKIAEHMRATGEWGEFFPEKFSFFGYNETLAYEYFPFKKEQALKRGYRWKDKEETEAREPTCEAPDHIKDVKPNFASELLLCQTCHKNYQVTPQELKFYLELKLPIPRHCPNCRHKARFNLRNPRYLWKRNCSKCQTELQTSYAPDRPEKIVCEACYLKEVY